jgi:S1-C subfamily serine protease
MRVRCFPLPAEKVKGGSTDKKVRIGIAANSPMVKDTMPPAVRLFVLVVSLAMSFSPVAVAQTTNPATSTATDVFSKSSSAVVTISAGSALGSGVIVHSSGVVVTNLHVIADAAKVAVKISNGDVYDDVAVVDFDSRKDLALIKVKGFSLPVAEIGDSDTARIGDRVFAIGAPKGLENTISEGIVSSLRDSGDGYRVIQTTAAISPGSSGGGLFDSQGRLIAITTFKINGGENLNFAVPINYVRGMLSTDISTEHRLTLTEFKEKLAQQSSDSTSSADAPAQTIGSAAPKLATAYVSVQKNSVALIEHNGERVRITFINPDGAVFGGLDLQWSALSKAFVGSGTLNTICGAVDTRIWAAPIQAQVFVMGTNIIRMRWSNPERVNCSRGLVTQYAWLEALWMVPAK